jgi:hypothetical protein
MDLTALISGLAALTASSKVTHCATSFMATAPLFQKSGRRVQE